MFVAIKAEPEEFNINNYWIEKEYSLDSDRNSPPSKRYVYNGLRLNASKAVFSVSQDKDSAIKEANAVYDHLDMLKIDEARQVSKLNECVSAKRIGMKYNFARLCALNSLSNLLYTHQDNKDIFACFPWFVQFWSRDSLISINSVMNKQHIKSVLLKYLSQTTDNSLLVNASLGSKDADSIGWVFKRIQDNIRLFNNKERSMIKKKIEACVNSLVELKTEYGFATNKENETWMDTSYNDDGRR